MTDADPDEFWSNRFHWRALAAGFLAASEGRLDDSAYVRKLAYEFFDTGAFRDRIAARKNDAITSPVDNGDDPRYTAPATKAGG